MHVQDMAIVIRVVAYATRITLDSLAKHSVNLVVISMNEPLVFSVPTEPTQVTEEPTQSQAPTGTLTTSEGESSTDTPAEPMTPEVDPSNILPRKKIY
jgi:hypothetical protein